MRSFPHDARFSPSGLVAAAGAHVVVIAAIWSLGSVPAVTAPTVLAAQLITPEAPPAPVVEPSPPKPVARPPVPMVKPQPRPAPAAAPRAPERLAAQSSAPAPSTEAPVRQEEAPVRQEEAPPAPPSPPTAPAAATAPAPASAGAPVAVSAPRFDADYLDNPAPGYPPLARRMREEGKVVLRVFVEPDGRPSQVTVKEGSGSPRLDRAAEEAVARWKFVPAHRGTEAVGAWVLVPIVFSLRG